MHIALHGAMTVKQQKLTIINSKHEFFVPLLLRKLIHIFLYILYFFSYEHEGNHAIIFPLEQKKKIYIYMCV